MADDRIPVLASAAVRRKIKRHGQEQPAIRGPLFCGLGVSEAEQRCAEEVYFDGRPAPWEFSGEEAEC